MGWNDRNFSRDRRRSSFKATEIRKGSRVREGDWTGTVEKIRITDGRVTGIAVLWDQDDDYLDKILDYGLNEVEVIKY